jgi:hypothetical protein
MIAKSRADRIGYISPVVARFSNFSKAGRFTRRDLEARAAR